MKSNKSKSTSYKETSIRKYPSGDTSLRYKDTKTGSSVYMARSGYTRVYPGKTKK
jgi:hypothetical protein